MIVCRRDDVAAEFERTHVSESSEAEGRISDLTICVSVEVGGYRKGSADRCGNVGARVQKL